MNRRNKLIFTIFLFCINVAWSLDQKPIYDEFVDQVNKIEEKNDQMEISFRKRAAAYWVKSIELKNNFRQFAKDRTKVKIKANMTNLEIVEGSKL